MLTKEDKINVVRKDNDDRKENHISFPQEQIAEKLKEETEKVNKLVTNISKGHIFLSKRGDL